MFDVAVVLDLLNLLLLFFCVLSDAFKVWPKICGLHQLCELSESDLPIIVTDKTTH